MTWPRRWAEVNSGVWDLETVRYVAGLSSVQVVPETSFYRDPEFRQSAIQETKRRCWAVLVEAAKVRAVDLELRDAVIDVDNEYVLRKGDEAFTALRVEARWWPQVKEVRLVGDERDGETFLLSAVRLSSRVHPWSPVEEFDYVIAGWNARDRHWLFSPEGFPL